MTSLPHRFTEKQITILETIMKGSPDGDFIDMDQLLETLPYETSKESMQFSIRALIKRNLVEKKPMELRRGRKRVVYALTPRALKAFDPHSGTFDVVVEGEV